MQFKELCQKWRIAPNVETFDICWNIEEHLAYCNHTDEVDDLTDYIKELRLYLDDDFFEDVLNVHWTGEAMEYDSQDANAYDTNGTACGHSWGHYTVTETAMQLKGATP